MEESKDNLITVILIIAIIGILILAGFIFRQILTEDDDNNNEYSYDGNTNAQSEIAETTQTQQSENTETTETQQSNNSTNSDIYSIIGYISMQKYHLDSENGQPATVYNKMLDELGKQPYFVYSEYVVYNDGSILTSYNEIDLKDCVKKQSGINSDGNWEEYKKWSGLLETSYIRYTDESNEWEKDTFTWFDQADILFSFLTSDFVIAYEEDYDYYYEENVTIDGNVYNKFTAKTNGNGNFYSASNNYYETDEEINIYLDTDSFLPIKAEMSYCSTINGNFLVSSNTTYDFEYSSAELSVPEELLNL